MKRKPRMMVQEKTIVEQLLPELMVMARVKHASQILDGTNISLCGVADNWVKCCTVTDMEERNTVQCMLWYNVGPGTFAVALEIKL